MPGGERMGRRESAAGTRGCPETNKTKDSLRRNQHPFKESAPQLRFLFFFIRGSLASGRDQRNDLWLPLHLPQASIFAAAYSLLR